MNDLVCDIHHRVQDLVERDAAVYGRDLAPYAGHAHRVAELTARQVDLRPQWVEPIAVAATFHDAAIWFDHTWDYLPGSAALAAREIEATDPGARDLVVAMIDEHHRIRRARHPHPLVEAMRRADATDVYRMTMPPGVTRADYRTMLRTFPDAGLHAMLARGFVMGLREGRANPMPMLKL